MRYGGNIILQCSECLALIEEKMILSGNYLHAIHWTDGKVDDPMFPSVHYLIKCPHCHELLWKPHQKTIDIVESLDKYKEKKSMPYIVPNFEDYYMFLDRNDQFLAKKNIKNEPIDQNLIDYHHFETWFQKRSKYFMDDSQEKPTKKQIHMINYMYELASKDGAKDYLTMARLKMQLGEIDAVKIILEKIDLDLELEEEEEMEEIEAIDFRYLHIKLWHEGNNIRRQSKNKSNESDCLLMAEIKRELGDFKEALNILNDSEFKDFKPAASIIKKLTKEKNPFVAQIIIDEGKTHD